MWLKSILLDLFSLRILADKLNSIATMNKNTAVRLVQNTGTKGAYALLANQLKKSESEVRTEFIIVIGHEERTEAVKIRDNEDGWALIALPKTGMYGLGDYGHPSYKHAHAIYPDSVSEAGLAYQSTLTQRNNRWIWNGERSQ